MRLVILGFTFLAFASACGPSRARCRPDTCSGCCTMDDQCVAGTANSQCGIGGNFCDVCVGTQACLAGRCMMSLFTVDAGGDAGTVETDAGAPRDAGTDAGLPDSGIVTTGPIVAPNEQWTWVPFPTAVCANGSATGIGINPSTTSTDIVVYMEGGGACWNQLTCVNFPVASNLQGYGAMDFARDGIRNAGAFNRTNVANPFRTASFVYIPYCTGDVHTGDTRAAYGIEHRGAANVRAYLARLRETFPGSRKIFLTGTSAGGYGVQLNYHRFAEAFPMAEIHALADSAQMINPMDPARLAEWVAAWNVADPPGCTGCTTNFNLVPGWLSSTYPNRRFALLAFSRDNVLNQFFGYDQTAFEMATTTLLMSQYQNKPNLKYYVVDPAAPTHVMLDEIFTRTAGGVPLSLFMQQWVTGDAAWANVRGM